MSQSRLGFWKPLMTSLAVIWTYNILGRLSKTSCFNLLLTKGGSANFWEAGLSLISSGHWSYVLEGDCGTLVCLPLLFFLPSLTSVLTSPIPVVRWLWDEWVFHPNKPLFLPLDYLSTVTEHWASTQSWAVVCCSYGLPRTFYRAISISLFWKSKRLAPVFGKSLCAVP